MKSKALQILVPEGNPNGMKVVELIGRPGKCFVIPRQVPEKYFADIKLLS